MNGKWKRKHSKNNVNLIKSETAVRVNQKHTCREFYTFMLKDKDILIEAQSNKKYILKFK